MAVRDRGGGGDSGSGVGAGASSASANSGGGAALVILHPWARLGGCCHDPTVVEIFEAAVRDAAQPFDVVLRYNMRAAGRSRAKACASRDPDADDLAFICRWLTDPDPAAAAPPPALATSAAPALPAVPPRRVALAGYSYGSTVAARALARLEAAPLRGGGGGRGAVAAYASVGFPLGLLSRWFLSAAGAWAALASAAAPKLVVMGTADQFTGIGQLRAAVAEHDAAAASAAAAQASGGAAAAVGPMDVEILEGADHFYQNRWDEVARLVVDWLARRLREAEEGDGGESPTS